jgi:chromosome segregation ATPase
MLLPGSVYSTGSVSADSAQSTDSRSGSSSKRRSLIDSVSKFEATSRSLLKIYMENQLQQNAEEIEGYEDVIKQLAGNIEELQADIGALESDLEITKTHNSALIEERDALQLRLSNFQIELTNERLVAQERIDNLSATVENCNQQIAELQVSLVDFNSVTKERAELTEKILLVESQLSFSHEENNALREEIANLEAAVDEIKLSENNEERMQEIIDEYETKVSGQAAELESLRSHVGICEEEISALQEENEVKDKELADKDREVEMTEKLLEEIQAAMKAQRTKIESSSKRSVTNTPIVAAGSSLLDEFNTAMPSPFPNQYSTAETEELKASKLIIAELEDKLRHAEEKCIHWEAIFNEQSSANDSLRNNLEAAYEETRKVQGDVSALQARLDFLVEENDGLSADNRDIKNKLELLVEKEISQQFVIDTLQGELAAEREQNDQLQLQCEELATQFEASEEGAAILMQEAASQRQRIDALMASLPAIDPHFTAKGLESPGSTRGFFKDGTNEQTPTNSRQTPRSRTNSNIDEMELRMVSFQRAVADLNSQLEVERAQATTKSQRIAEISEEWERVKVDLEVKSAQFEGQQIHIERLEEDLASLRTELESSGLQYQTEIKKLELELLETCHLVEEKESELQELVESNNELEDFVKETAEREEAFEDEISQLKYQSKELEEEIRLLTSKCQAVTDLHESSLLLVDNLQQELAQSRALTAQREHELLERITMMASASESSSQDAMRSEMQETISKLTQHLEQIEKEKNDIQSALSENRQKIIGLETALSEKSSAVQRLEDDIVHTRNEMESSAVEYQTQIKKLELELLEVCHSLEEKEGDLQELRASNEDLEEAANESVGREQEFEEEISRLKLQSKELELEISELTAKCESIQNLHQSSLAVIENLRQELQSRELAVVERIGLLTSESENSKEQMQSDVQETIAKFMKQLEQIQMEKIEIQRAVFEQKQAYESALDEKTAQIQQQQENAASVTTLMYQFQEHIGTAQASLLDSVDSKLVHVSSRIDDCFTTVCSEIEGMRAVYEQQIEEFSAELATAEEREEASTTEKLELLESLKDSNLQKIELERTVQSYLIEIDSLNERVREMSDQNNRNLDGVAKSGKDELAKLSERLECAERRAEELTVNGAQAFAKSSRAIAYLEGECSKLTSVGDYYRGVNVKLLDDLKAVREEALQIGGLQYQLQVSHQSEMAFRLQIESLNALVLEKDHQLLASQSSLHEAETEYARQLEIARIDWKEGERADDAKILELSDDLARVRSKFEMERLSLENEIARLNSEVDGLEQVVNEYKDEQEKMQQELVDKGEENGLLMESVLGLQSQLQSSKSEIELLIDSADKQKVEFDATMTHKNHRMKELEGGIAQLKASLADSESNNQMKDEVITSSLSKQSALSAEIRELQTTVEKQSSEIFQRSEEHAEALRQLKATSDELETCELELVKLQNYHPASQEKISSLEDTIRWVDNFSCCNLFNACLLRIFRHLKLEISVKNQDYDVLKSSHSLISDSSSHAEKRAQLLQTSLAVAEGEIDALRTKNDVLAEECQHWNQQLDEVSKKFAGAAKELSHVRGQLVERENEAELLANKVIELESQVDTVAAQCRIFESSQEALAAEMKEFYDRIYELANEDGRLHADVLSTPNHGLPASGAAVGNGKNLVSEFFNTPIQQVSFDHLKFDSATTTPFADGKKASLSNNVSPRGASINSIRQIFIDIKSNSLQLYGDLVSAESQLAECDKVTTEQRRRADLAEQELLSALENDKQMQSEVQILEEELESLRASFADVSFSRTRLLTSADEFAQSMRDQLTKLDSFVADIVARSNVSVAGRLLPKSNGDVVSISVSVPSVPHHAHSHSALIVSDNHATVDFGISSLFAVSVSIVEGAMLSLSNAIESCLADAAVKANKVEVLELQLRDNSRAWGKDKEDLLAQLTSLRLQLQQSSTSHVHYESEIEKLERAIEKSRLVIQEYANQKEELESEYKSAMENVHSLQAAFNEAETVCLDLHSKIRSYANDASNKADEIRYLQDQLEQTAKRASGAELTLQKVGIDCDRYKSERDSLVTVKKTLELELEKLRKENTAALVKANDRASLEEENRSKFVVEKLLSALGSSLDALSTNLAAGRPGSLLNTSASFDSLQNISDIKDETSTRSTSKQSIFSPIGQRLRSQDILNVSANDSDVSTAFGDNSFSSDAAKSLPLEQRVELAVKRLADIRTWSRDESKSRKILLERLETMNSEGLRLQRHIDELQGELHQASTRETERICELKERGKQLAELHSKLAKNAEDMSRLRDDQSQLASLMDEERRSKSKLTAELQIRDTEIKRLTLKLENMDTTVRRNEEEITNCNSRMAELCAERESYLEQLQTTKANNARLSASLGLLEKGLDRDLSDRGALQQKLSMVQSTASESLKLKSQISDLETGLHQAKEQLRSAVDARGVLDDQGRRLVNENESFKRRLVSAEARIEQLQKDKLALQETTLELNLTVSRITQQLDLESASKTRAETALAALSRSERTKTLAGDYSALVEEVEEKVHIDEEEQNQLRSMNHALKLALDEKESQRHAENSRCTKLEKDVSTLKQKLSRAITDLSDADTKASVLRAQGRKARNQVVEAINQIRSSIDLVRSDSLLLGGKGVDSSLLMDDGKRNDYILRFHTGLIRL